MTVMAYRREEAETIINATAWTEIAEVTFSWDMDTTEEFIAWGYCEYTIANASERVEVRILLNSVEVANDSFSPAVAGQFRSFSPMGLKALGVGVHYITLEAKGSSLDNVTVRRKRLLVMKH